MYEDNKKETLVFIGIFLVTVVFFASILTADYFLESML